MIDHIALNGMTWDHTRGYVPMAATAQRFHELNPHVDILWSKRSLQAFADKPLAELAEQFDLLVIDHPWAGFAAAHGILLPLEEYLPAEFLTKQAANSVGRSHKSYLEFQDRAGDPIHAYLREGGNPETVLDTLDNMYRETNGSNA